RTSNMTGSTARPHPGEPSIRHTMTMITRHIMAGLYRLIENQASGLNLIDRLSHPPNPCSPRCASPQANGKALIVLPSSKKRLFNVEPLSDARTPLTDFFSILLKHLCARMPHDGTLHFSVPCAHCCLWPF